MSFGSAHSPSIRRAGRGHMDPIQAKEEAVEVAVAEEAANHRASWPRSLLAATIPPIADFLIQSLYWLPGVRWSLYYPAVFLASWLGGFRAGIGATMLSTALLWWYFMPPEQTIFKSNPRSYLTAITFIVLGYVVSALHRKLRRLTRDFAMALIASRKLTERLETLVEERRMLMTLIENTPDFIGFVCSSRKRPSVRRWWRVSASAGSGTPNAGPP